MCKISIMIVQFQSRKPHVKPKMASHAQPRNKHKHTHTCMSQPPLSVIGSDPLMRRGANRGPASITEREWLWQPYLKIMAGLTPITLCGNYAHTVIPSKSLIVRRRARQRVAHSTIKLRCEHTMGAKNQGSRSAHLIPPGARGGLQK